MTRSASAKASLVSEPVTSPLQPAGPVGGDAVPAGQLVDLGVHVAHAGVDARLVQVGQHHRDFELPGEQQADLRGHQASPDHADLGHRPRQRLVRGAGRAPGALLGQVEGVQAGCQLIAHDQVGQGLVLGGERLVPAAVLRRRDQLQRPVGGGGSTVQLAVGEEPGRADGGVPVFVNGGPADDDAAGQHAGRPAQRLLQEVGGLEHGVRDAELEGLRAAQHPVLAERVLDDDLQRPGRADQPGQQVGAAPARHQAEERLGQRHGRDTGRDRAVRAVQRDLDPAAHRRAVDERERRDVQLAQAAEHRVAEPADALGLVPAADQADPLEVGADREDERLAGDADRGDVVPGGHRVDGVVQLEQARGAERARLGVVEAVVQGDQGERPSAAGQVDVTDVGVRDDLARVQGPDRGGVAELFDAGHRFPSFASCCMFSQRTVAPMPIPMHIVVRP